MSFPSNFLTKTSIYIRYGRDVRLVNSKYKKVKRRQWLDFVCRGVDTLLILVWVVPVVWNPNKWNSSRFVTSKERTRLWCTKGTSIDFLALTNSFCIHCIRSRPCLKTILGSVVQSRDPDDDFMQESKGNSSPGSRKKKSN
jgi:hypothetical protein